MFARTERLMLRPGWIEDAAALATAIGEEAVVRNLVAAPWPYAPEDAARFLSAPRNPALPELLMFARTHGAPRLVGGIGLTCDTEGSVELGYWIARPYWGLGFATEAGHAMMSLADDGLRLPRIVAGHFLNNPASGHVLRKLGFSPTGRITTRFNAARDGSVPRVEYERTVAADTRWDMPRLAA